MSEAATIEHKLPPTERIAVKAKDAAASERAVKEKILEAARREGFAGTSDERIGALGWTIRRVLPTDASPSQPLPASGGDVPMKGE